jgi:hypothetical protein
MQGVRASRTGTLDAAVRTSLQVDATPRQQPPTPPPPPPRAQQPAVPGADAAASVTVMGVTCPGANPAGGLPESQPSSLQGAHQQLLHAGVMAGAAGEEEEEEAVTVVPRSVPLHIGAGTWDTTAPTSPRHVSGGGSGSGDGGDGDAPAAACEADVAPPVHQSPLAAAGNPPVIATQATATSYGASITAPAAASNPAAEPVSEPSPAIGLISPTSATVTGPCSGGGKAGSGSASATTPTAAATASITAGVGMVNKLVAMYQQSSPLGSASAAAAATSVTPVSARPGSAERPFLSSGAQRVVVAVAASHPLPRVTRSSSSGGGSSMASSRGCSGGGGGGATLLAGPRCATRGGRLPQGPCSLDSALNSRQTNVCSNGAVGGHMVDTASAAVAAPHPAAAAAQLQPPCTTPTPTATPTPPLTPYLPNPHQPLAIPAASSSLSSLRLPSDSAPHALNKSLPASVSASEALSPRDRPLLRAAASGPNNEGRSGSGGGGRGGSKRGAASTCYVTIASPRTLLGQRGVAAPLTTAGVVAVGGAAAVKTRVPAVISSRTH